MQTELAKAGKPYELPFAERVLPELPAEPTWRDVLQRSFLANGDIEAAYFRWKAAVDRIGIAGAYPNSDVSLGFEYMFSRERMKSFDRTTFSAGFDQAMSLSLPVKVAQAAKVALDEARKAGDEFRVAKFNLQRTVLQSWADYVLQEQTLALREADLRLQRTLLEAATGAAQAGRRVRDVRTAELEYRLAESRLADLRNEQNTNRAKLNVLMGRGPQLALNAPRDLPPARAIPDDDLVLIRAAAETFPEVAVSSREVEGRADALELARLRWVPDISPTLGFTGSLSQTIGAMVRLPTTIAAIRGQIREAESDLRAAQALLRQRTSDRVGEYFALLVMYRNAQRQLALFNGTLIPAADSLSADQLHAYEAGAATFSDMVESRRLALSLREMSAASRAVLEKTVVEIECCLGVDIERLAEPSVPHAAPIPPPDPSHDHTLQKEVVHAD